MAARTERTFYHYQLLRKIHFNRFILGIYLALAVIGVAAAVWSSSIMGLIYAFLAWTIVIWIHYVIARSIFIMDRYTYKKRWGFQMKLPWIGFLPLPQQYISDRYMRKVNLHTLLIGFVIILILTPWLPISFSLQFVFWHIWLLIPRLYVLIAVLSIPDDKLLKIQPQQCLIYKA
ncbi:MAG: hypothetical protein IKE34_10290 [Paenibacillus sp.]|nr:hypothetical protein [Paenibacillus sp.]